MGVKSYRIQRPHYFHEENTVFDVWSVWSDVISYNSPRINGKLRLQANSYSKRKQTWSPIQTGSIATWSRCNPGSGSIVYQSGLMEPLVDSCDSRAYARFRGKLYKGGAALGVTLASYRQSRDMVLQSYMALNHSAKVILDDIERHTRKRRYSRLDGYSVGLPKEIARRHLETIFGWQPLLADINSVLSKLCQGAMPPEFVRASAKGFDASVKQTDSLGIIGHQTFTLESRVTLAALVRVSNPNLWLAERAGTLNAAAVAWDLVPWSFIVNMFVNTGQVVNSITDFYGLSFEEQSRTVTTFGTLHAYARMSNPPPGKAYPSELRSEELLVHRSLGPFPRPPLTFKAPDASWSTVAMAASLFIQKLPPLRILWSLRRPNLP